VKTPSKLYLNVQEMTGECVDRTNIPLNPTKSRVARRGRRWL